jgi:hypothetical protein
MSFIVRAVASAAVALAMLALANGLSFAKGDPLAGKTYKEASAAVSGWGATPVINTVLGDQLAMDECIVTTSQKSHRQIDGGRKVVFLINLYCNNGVAQAGTPGNSVTSAQGKVAAKNIKTAEWCSLPAQAGKENCAKWCDSHDGMCTANF